VEQSSGCIELIFCGLHHFDLVLEMDEVLKFVSPDILRWNGLTKPQEYYAPEDTNVIYILATNWQTMDQKAA
jgi:hypothetical protein